jgi:glycerophosphoryl diester phosphodiesterase
MRIALTALAAAALLGGGAAAQNRPVKTNIAHRGASAYAPEHTIPAYRLALEQRADYVEQDLAVTLDGELICLHDDTLDRTTDVESLFAGRPNDASRTPGQAWLANDLTLAEIRRLDAGRWFGGTRVPTWQEAVDLVRGKAGLYPELKSPPLYTARGVDMVRLFVDSVKKNQLDSPESLRTTPVIIQSFDEATIRRVATELPSIPRVLLMESFDAPMTDARLRQIAAFATGIGPAKHLVDQQPDLVRHAHAAGLTVTAYTFRSRDTSRFPDVRAEMRHFLFTLGIDAVFTDNPDQFPRTP